MCVHMQSHTHTHTHAKFSQKTELIYVYIQLKINERSSLYKCRHRSENALFSRYSLAKKIQCIKHHWKNYAITKIFETNSKDKFILLMIFPLL